MNHLFWRSSGGYLLLFSALISLAPLTFLQFFFNARAHEELKKNVASEVAASVRTARLLYSHRLLRELDGIRLFAQVTPLDETFVNQYFFSFRSCFTRVAVFDRSGTPEFAFLSTQSGTSRVTPINDDLESICDAHQEQVILGQARFLGVTDATGQVTTRFCTATPAGSLVFDIDVADLFRDVSGDMDLKHNQQLLIRHETHRSFSPDPLAGIPASRVQRLAANRFDARSSILRWSDFEYGVSLGVSLDYRSMAQSLDQTLKVGLLATLGLGIAVMSCIWFAARWLQGQMSKLTSGARQIAQGHFDQTIDIPRPSELRTLGRRFNDMAVRLRALIREKTAAESFAAVGRFASFFAHDLKSPLAGTLMLAKEAKNEAGSESRFRAHLEEIVLGLERMTRSVHDTLAFSKVAAPKLTPIDVNRLVRDAAAEFSAQHPCTISVTNEGVEPIAADRGLLHRVFFNLFLNAFEARSDTCRIDVTLSMQDAWIEVIIKDNGAGIDVHSQPHVFDPFHTSKRSGCGLGLAFVKETMKNHRGSVTLTSQIDRGTCIHLQFPRQNTGSGGEA